MKPSSTQTRPRIGVPWRTEKQERKRDLRYNQDYLDSVRRAGGEPVQISLLLPAAKLAQLASTLDAFILPGSPADIDPKLFGAASDARSSQPDASRQKTDFALLDHALPAGKPVLATCYGIQSLNVHLGGSLTQDIPSQLRGPLLHSSRGDQDATHPIRIAGGRLAVVAGRRDARVNSSHHQSVRRPGRHLRVTATAPDGVIEALEWTGGPGWVVGVQWHPERMPRDPLAQRLFRRLVSEAIVARNSRSAPPRSSRAAKPARRGKAAPKRAARRSGSLSAKAGATRKAAKAPNKSKSRPSARKRK